MRPEGTAKELERRRHRAIALLNDGYGVRETARIVGVTPGAVSQWRQAYETVGESALACKSVPGRPPKLTAKDRHKLERLLLQGPQRHGYGTALWILARVAQLIRKHLAVTYDLSGVWHVLRAMGWSCQKPERRARERDEQRIEQWHKHDWPRVRRNAKDGL